MICYKLIEAILKYITHLINNQITACNAKLDFEDIGGQIIQ